MLVEHIDTVLRTIDGDTYHTRTQKCEVGHLGAVKSLITEKVSGDDDGSKRRKPRPPSCEPARRTAIGPNIRNALVGRMLIKNNDIR